MIGYLRTGERRGAAAIVGFTAHSLDQASMLLVTLLATRFLLPEEYGVYTLSIVFVLLIQTMIYSGVYEFIVTSREEDDILLSTSFWLMVGLSALGALIFAAMAGWIAGIYQAPGLAPILRALCALQPFAAAIGWLTAVLIRRRELTTRYSFMIVQNVSALIGGVVLLVSWQSVNALVGYHALRLAIGLALAVVWIRIFPSLQFERAIALRSLRFASGLYGAKFMTFLSKYGADLLLGLTFSTGEAGLYRFGNRLASSAVKLVDDPLRAFALSAFGAAGRNGDDYQPLVERFSSTGVLLTGCMVGTILVLGELAVEVLFRPEYTAALVVMYALALRHLFSVSSYYFDAVLASKDKTDVVMRFRSIWAAIGLAVVFVTAPFGLAAVAFGSAVVGFFMSAFSLATLSRHAGIALCLPLRAMWNAAAVALAYTLGVMAITLEMTHLVDSRAGALCLSLLLSGALGCAVLVIAHRRSLFHLSVFN